MSNYVCLAGEAKPFDTNAFSPFGVHAIPSASVRYLDLSLLNRFKGLEYW